MKKKENEVVDFYEGKISVEDRLILLLTGVCFFPVGFALFFYFEDKKDRKYHAHFAKTGAWTGFIIFLFVLLSAFLFTLAG